jgi:hypothetical protein
MTSKSLKVMVGAVRFELTTLCSQSRCATRLRYAPNSFNLTAHASDRQVAPSPPGAPSLRTCATGFSVPPPQTSQQRAEGKSQTRNQATLTKPGPHKVYYI